MRVRLSGKYTGRQILDAFRSALLLFNCGGKVWTIEERHDGVAWEFGSLGKPKSFPAIQAIGAVSMKKPA